MVKLTRSFSRFKSSKVLVIGDFMLDSYTTGKVERISPEAPVPVLHVEQAEDLPGGAGNVVRNLFALGAEVVAVGRIGNDKEGDRLKGYLEAGNTDTRGLFCQKGYHTPIKNRIIANAQQLLRIDHETPSPIDPEVEKQVIAFIQQEIESIEVIAISDYGKGFLSRALLKKCMELGKKHQIPVLVDPKGDDFTKYRGATLIKPNLKEAYIASKLPHTSSIDEVAEELLDLTQSDMLMITRSEEGISLFSRAGERHDFSVRKRKVKDVTGAGDTVLAMIVMAFASGVEIHSGLMLANVAAGIAIEQIGCAPVSLGEIAERLLEIDATDKVFDENHLFVLEHALQGKELTVLGLSSKEGISSLLFRHIQGIAKESTDERLMVYLVDTHPDPDFVTFLASLDEVDYIVLQSESLSSICERIHPKRVMIYEGETLTSADHHDHLLV